jgi:hypothetical protein
MGTFMTNCTDWDYVQVRDFEVLRKIYSSEVEQYEADYEKIEDQIKQLGEDIKYKLGFYWPYLNSEQSKYTLDLYDETINLGSTYYQMNTDDL